MNENDKLKSHIEEVFDWLEKNVTYYDAHQSITLFDFEINWNEMSGSFRMKFDNEFCLDRGNFYLSNNGKLDFSLPMFHSPLGAPASYPAINIKQSTEHLIADILNTNMPRFKPLGIDKETGVHFSASTPIKDRIVSNEAFQVAKKKFSDKNHSLEKMV